MAPLVTAAPGAQAALARHPSGVLEALVEARLLRQIHPMSGQ